jgi:hypothetical protein
MSCERETQRGGIGLLSNDIASNSAKVRSAPLCVQD